MVPGELGPGQPQALQWHRGERCLVGKDISPEVLGLWQQEACDRNGQPGGSRDHRDQLSLQLCSQPGHPLNCAWAAPQVKQRQCLTPLPSSALI